MKKITPQMAHDEIVKSIGHYGWYALNDYLELRNVILFGERKHGYVPDLDKMLDGKTIDKALELMDGDLIVSIRPTNYDGWMLNILPMGRGYVNGTDFTMMNACFPTLDECLSAKKGEHNMKSLKQNMYNRIKAYFHEHNKATSEEIWDKVFNFQSSLKMVSRIHQKVVEDTIDDIFNSISN